MIKYRFEEADFWISPDHKDQGDLIKKCGYRQDQVELLTGGRLNQVYRLGQDRVLKICQGPYRMQELVREARAMTLTGNMSPDVIKSHLDDDHAYMVQTLVQGPSLRESLASRSKEELWRQVGQVMSRIHSLLKGQGDQSVWLEGLLTLADHNMNEGLIDLEDLGGLDPQEVLNDLRAHRPRGNRTCLLHGDLRTKNILMSDQGPILIDWGFVDLGDPYYDLAIIDYYFKTQDDRQAFYEGYGDLVYDQEVIDYYDKLSWFINI